MLYFFSVEEIKFGLKKKENFLSARITTVCQINDVICMGIKELVAPEEGEWSEVAC